MEKTLRPPIGLLLGLSLFPSALFGQAHSSAAQPLPKDTTEVKHATGTFEVKLKPQPPDAAGGEPVLGRMTIDKQLRGDLEGTSKGEMLAIMTEVKDSAGYVAMERVTGTLHGKKGSFALQHSGTMAKGVPQLSVTVVPDSGTGDLIGLSGRMTIDIAGGKHSYTFDYTIARP